MTPHHPLRKIAVLLGPLLALALAASAVCAQDSFGGSAAAPARAGTPPPKPPDRTGRSAGPGVSVAPDADERADTGVRAPSTLHAGAMHGPTPASIPGGRLVTTTELVALLKAGPGGEPPLIFDVLGGPQQLPGALYAVPAHQPGSFDDATQREFGAWLQTVTQGRQDRPMVFYCASTQCWMSYNAALRAIRMGYRQVLWYRGGLQSWQQAGQPVQSAQAGGETSGAAGQRTPAR